jgi:hypothetical protein
MQVNAADDLFELTLQTMHAALSQQVRNRDWLDGWHRNLLDL